MNTPLDLLCKVHGQQGGTIHQFNEFYGIDFLTAKPEFNSGSFRLGHSAGVSNIEQWKEKYIFYPEASFDSPTQQTKINFIFGFLSAYADSTLRCTNTKRQENYFCDTNPDSIIPCPFCKTWDITL